MVNRALAWGGAAGVAVGAGVGQQGRDGPGGVVRQGSPDGDLVHVAAVEGLDVERGEQGFLDPGRGGGEHVGSVGQQVQQGGVVVRGRGCFQVRELGFGGGALGVQVGEPGADAGAVGLGGRVSRVGRGLQFGDQAALGGVDAGQFGAQTGLGAGLALGMLGGGGGELGGEVFGAVAPEDVPVEESADGVNEGVFAEHDVAVVGVGGGLAGVGRVVRALILRGQSAAHGLSFPSGHAVVIFAITAVVAPYFKSWWKVLPWALAAAVCLSRVYLGAHFSLDVAAGAGLGLFIGGVLNLVFGVPSSSSSTARASR
jgi:hypothetical protein